MIHTIVLRSAIVKVWLIDIRRLEVFGWSYRKNVDKVKRKQHGPNECSTFYLHLCLLSILIYLLNFLCPSSCRPVPLFSFNSFLHTYLPSTFSLFPFPLFVLSLLFVLLAHFSWFPPSPTFFNLLSLHHSCFCLSPQRAGWIMQCSALIIITIIIGLSSDFSFFFLLASKDLCLFLFLFLALQKMSSDKHNCA